MTYLVLGMHKSGTTLIAQTLHKSGINMGWDLSEEDLDYSRQKCESPSVNEINYELLDCKGVHSLDVHSNKQLNITPAVKDSMNKFINRQNKNYSKWGFKDPRTVLTYSVWNQFLPRHKVVVVYRKPDNVVRHYQKKAKGFNLFRACKTLWVWKKYNLEILSILKDKSKEEMIVINYDNMMNGDEEFGRISTFTGMDIVDMRDFKTGSKNKKFPAIYVLLKYLFGINRVLDQLNAVKQEMDNSE